MVINSTNINKTKESLNSDGHQFYQYQQNKDSLNSDGHQFHHYQQHLILTHCIQKKPWHMTLEIQVLAWDRHKNVASETPTLSSW